MGRKFNEVFSKIILNFFEAIVNLFFFLPYFFSVTTLLSTLVSPWKNITSQRRERGFTLNAWLDRTSFNIISRLMGASVRISVLLFFLMVQSLYIISVPFLIIIFFFLLPPIFIISLFLPSEAEKKDKQKQIFLTQHLLKNENKKKVEQWFEEYYEKKSFEAQWWKLKNLFATPPLGRDWAVGYTPLLDEFSQDLTSTIYQTNIEHLVDREKEIEQIERSLCKTEGANVIIVGEEGVGKQTILDAFAKKVYEGKISKILMYKRILKINLEQILTEYTDQKQRENFLEQLFEEANKAQNIIITISDFDKYVSNNNGHINLSIPLEKYAQKTTIHFIAVTTPYAYQEYVSTNEKINMIFNKIDVYEISEEKAISILLDKHSYIEEKYGVIIPYEIIQAIVEKSDYYITNIPFPEKAMQILDEACIYTIKILKSNKVSSEAVDKVLTEKTHIPTDIDDTVRQQLISLESLLSDQIVNQPQAIKKLSLTLRNSFILKNKRKKPLATLLFLGPTGVGKTETAKSIARIFFGSEKELIRFDMSLYQSLEDIHQLIGSSQGNNIGLLTEALRKKPYGVLLLDEIEKAHPNLLNIFLTILDEGYFTDPTGKKVDCRNIIIIATSNAGSSYLYKNISVTSQEFINYIISEKIFTPEFINRFDGAVLYNLLTLEDVTTIAKRMIKTVSGQLYDLYKINIDINDSTIKNLVNKNYSTTFGARDIKRYLKAEIEDQVAKLILEKKFKEGDTVTI